MNREEALTRYDRIRYNLLNSDDKAAVDVAFEALRDQRNCCKNGNSWISVEDRLPPEGERVLVCREVLFKGDKIIDIDVRIHANSARTGTEWADNLRSWKSVVTHWMPLPSAPEEEV